MTVKDPQHKKIPVVEIFGPTIQGEGLVIGQQTYFIRFGLCDYRCTMCDSMHAVDPIRVKEKAQWLMQADIFEKFKAHAEGNTTAWVTYSGGNPCMHDLYDLTRKLVNVGFKIAVETQGTIWEGWLSLCDVVTVSPKGPGMGEKFEEDKFRSFLRRLNGFPRIQPAIKVVMFDERDIAFAEEILRIMQACGSNISQLYLSQGNPYPPGYFEESHPIDLAETLRQNYLEMFSRINKSYMLSRAKFLPQFHVWLWGNRQGV